MRFLTYLLGFLFGAVFLGASSWAFPGIWLPFALGLAVTIVLLGLPELARHPLTGPYVATFTLAFTLVWIRSGSATPRTSAALVGSTLLLFLVLSLAWLVTRGLLAKDRRLVLPYALMLILACGVARLSGGAGGADPMIEWFQSLFGLSPDAAHTAVVAFRKTVHFAFYGLFALTALRAALAVDALPRAALILALTLVLCLASFDELRQASSPGRTGSLLDVGLDMVGAGTFAALAYRRALHVAR